MKFVKVFSSFLWPGASSLYPYSDRAVALATSFFSYPTLVLRERKHGLGEIHFSNFGSKEDVNVFEF